MPYCIKIDLDFVYINSNFDEYKAKMAESIEHDLLESKRAVQFVKN